MLKKLALVLIFLAVAILGYSTTLPAYSNQEEYESKYLTLKIGSSSQFFELRQNYLTAKFTLEDYGVTILVIAIFMLIIFSNGWENFRTPKNKIIISLIGFLAVLATVGGNIGSLFLEFNRGSFPYWADSLIIPLMRVPTLFLVSLIWYLLNLIGLKGSFQTAALIKNLTLKKINYWYLLLFVFTMLSIIKMILHGNFWAVLSDLLWVYFYLAILVGRQAAK